MKKILPITPFILCICLLRASNLSIRLSDTNIYFYTAYELLQGKLLYKDIFFTNFPLFPYLSSLYLLISNNNILFYYFTPTIEISCITLLIYVIVYKKTQTKRIAFFSSLLYLFSFIVLSTSEHQTGVFQASIFALLAYFFWERKKYFITGIFITCALLTKAYFIPVILSFFCVLLLKKKYSAFFYQLLGCIVISILLLTPSIIVSGYDLYKDIIQYSLTRSAGVSKIDILWFFITKDTIFFGLLVFNIFYFKRNYFYGFLSIFTIVFFIFYKDPYYLYFNFLAPFLAISLYNFISFTEKKFALQKMILPTFLVLFLLYTFSLYFVGYRNLGTITNFRNVLTTINKINPSTIYGVNDITPVLSFMTQTPLLHNIVDTNTNIFRKGILNATTLTKDAVKQKSMVVVHGAFYPQYGINETVMDEIVDKKILLKKCNLVLSEQIYTEGLTNRINLFSCNKISQ